MGGPLTAASKMVPVPESLMSPDCCPTEQINTARLNCSPQLPKALKCKENRSSTSLNKTPRTNKRNDKTSSPTLSPRRIHSNLNTSRSSTVVQHLKTVHHANHDISPDDENDHINVEKLRTIRCKAAQKTQKHKENTDLSAQQIISDNATRLTENSAILIQKLWRGYSTRKKTEKIVEILQKKRIQDYLGKLSMDMEQTKAALESDRKMQQFQMQAINALWKKVNILDGSKVITGENKSSGEVMMNINSIGNVNANESVNVVQDLTKTCSLLTTQVI